MSKILNGGIRVILELRDAFKEGEPAVRETIFDSGDVQLEWFGSFPCIVEGADGEPVRKGQKMTGFQVKLTIPKGQAVPKLVAGMFLEVGGLIQQRDWQQTVKNKETGSKSQVKKYGQHIQVTSLKKADRPEWWPIFGIKSEPAIIGDGFDTLDKEDILTFEQRKAIRAAEQAAKEAAEVTDEV